MAAFAAFHSFGGNHAGNMTVVDKVLPEMLHLVDPHWYQFQPSKFVNTDKVTLKKEKQILNLKIDFFQFLTSNMYLFQFQ